MRIEPEQQISLQTQNPFVSHQRRARQWRHWCWFQWRGANAGDRVWGSTILRGIWSSRWIGATTPTVTHLSLSLYAWIGGLLTPLHGGTWRNDVSSVGKREAVVMVAGGSASLWLFNCLGLFGHKKRKEICRLFGDCWVGDDVVFLFSWHSFIGPTHHIVEIAYSTIAADMLPR